MEISDPRNMHKKFRQVGACACEKVDLILAHVTQTIHVLQIDKKKEI